MKAKEKRGLFLSRGWIKAYAVDIFSKTLYNNNAIRFDLLPTWGTGLMHKVGITL